MITMPILIVLPNTIMTESFIN
ncbi:hypothetical protein CY0110_19247 [Crocosphaera chwakensis CCY0110]|uniref:Uncharacterized protein n=1 Tax=Crocosphaera chwakensis CCY0110 TaxID=391612 RepID=A3IJI1_9CHRO|nr:hypothetical protein CY0110_19247 [Crocosphaera chwakensis CCY0110]